ncbi:ABC transporter substrate-binding protein [Nocardioides lianchengensis]|uniref:Peptide/nickel transport system substrate-binding protein n=1 Tax=Nocardioides lianchengensis TaxID=1045774 RepID=A0A1G6ZY32_9ACTN|nr:ABC transporter substrate-binding protein [Nocardioides lianchengensis]NYG12283.1 peptide/nickel transport system substrate-binding protein [Nocardioides lianchengensis]SDE07594.1 peptide/nickel transport system substrate-binding protein [Nocardioides lianchengensis]
MTRTRTPLAATQSRRGFLGLSLAAGLVLSLEACGGGSSGSSGGSGTNTLTWAWQLPTTWDPVTSSAGSDVQMLALAYDPITALDEQGNAVPWLAESWAYDAAGTTVTFTLRSGLKFSDGTPLNAAAVAKSIERGRSQDGSLIAPQMKSIKSVAASGELDVVIELTEVDYQYPLLFAGKTGMVVNPAAFEKDVDALATQPAGSGPFAVTSYVQNDHASLKRNPNFFAADEITIKALELYPQQDPATVVAGVQSGQFNLARISGAQVEAAEAAGLDVQVIDSMFVSVLDVNASMAPFDDPAVVEAMKFAIDREKLKEVVGFGVGDVNYQPFPPGYVGYNEELADVYAYDPEKAKQLLADAGHTSPVKAVFTSSGQSAPAVELIQAQLKDVGIDATIETIPQTQHTQLVYLEHSKALTYDGFAGRESPVQAFQVLFGAEGLMNPARQTDPKLEAQLEKVKQTPTDSPEYAGLLQEATRIAVTTFPNTFLQLMPTIVIRKGVSELPASPSLRRFEGVTVS